jgi:serine/threonine protein kinase
MMSVNIADAKQIFLQAVENHEPQRWREFLDDACGTDSALRERVEALLAAYRQPNPLLDGNNDMGAQDQRSVAEGPGTVIGPYKLLEQLGEGGFGVVFLAEQERPVRRRVALKIIKPGMDTRQVIARFEAERQALAMMDHPNIAKVHDGGVTENGRPYFVMELVHGVPITEYCDQCNLTTQERLELFVIVCQAVQHAHQKGVIHRDIKPTNVLVAMQDDRPAPTIIDFGVAKAVGQRLTEHTLTTAFAQMVGSPLYMSPEQAELSPLGVDTRCDIYSLGVLLYEMLTGTTPFEKDRLHAASYDELRRIIREEEPPRPSARISTLAADLATTVANHRRTDTRRLSQQVRGELDWIVMKCLEKDRNRRYDSVGSLARDVERYLHDEPVQACPPSALLRLRKYARRNKVPLAFVSLLVIGLVFQGISNLAIKRERDAKSMALTRAQTVSAMLQEMLASHNADELEAAARRGIDLNELHASGFEGYPAAEAEVAISYAWFANFLAATHRQEEANAAVRKAADHLAHAAEGGLAPALHVNALYDLAIAQLRVGDGVGYRQACTAMLRVPTDNDDDNIRYLRLRIWCLGPHAGEDLSLQLKQAEELAAHSSPGDWRSPWHQMGVLGSVLYRAGRYEQAARCLKESIAAYPDGLAPVLRTPLDPRLLLAMTNWQLGRWEEARHQLAEMQPALDEWLQSPNNPWLRRAQVDVLRREAEALIKPKKVVEAPSDNNPTSAVSLNPEP